MQSCGVPRASPWDGILNERPPAMAGGQGRGDRMALEGVGGERDVLRLEFPLA